MRRRWSSVTRWGRRCPRDRADRHRRARASLAAAVLARRCPRLTVRYAWARASRIIGDSLPFWVDLKLRPATIAYARCSLVAGALSALPAQRPRARPSSGTAGITSTGGTMSSAASGRSSSAPVACTLLWCPPRWASSPTPQRPVEVAAFRRALLTFRRRGQRSARRRARCADDGQSPRVARAYEELAIRLREAWCDSRGVQRSPADDVPE
jgi:hypothetical protein